MLRSIIRLIHQCKRCCLLAKYNWIMNNNNNWINNNSSKQREISWRSALQLMIKANLQHLNHLVWAYCKRVTMVSTTLSWLITRWLRPWPSKSEERKWKRHTSHRCWTKRAQQELPQTITFQALTTRFSPSKHQTATFKVSERLCQIKTTRSSSRCRVWPMSTHQLTSIKFNNSHWLRSWAAHAIVVLTLSGTEVGDLRKEPSTLSNQITKLKSILRTTTTNIRWAVAARL